MHNHEPTLPPGPIPELDLSTVKLNEPTRTREPKPGPTPSRELGIERIKRVPDRILREPASLIADPNTQSGKRGVGFNRNGHEFARF